MFGNTSSSSLHETNNSAIKINVLSFMICFIFFFDKSTNYSLSNSFILTFISLNSSISNNLVKKLILPSLSIITFLVTPAFCPRKD